MKHAIITSTDARYGDFVVDHWYPSLYDNVDLQGIDVVVLDFGLNEVQQQRLESAGVMLHPSRRDGHVCNIRYRELATFLASHAYDQVLFIDGGDIIFQTDIRHLFDQDKETIRCVCEEREIPFHDLILPQTDMDPETYRRMFEFLKGKPTINSGVLFGPASTFKDMWKEFQRHCNSFDVFGHDQLLINDIVYRNEFKQLEKKYNFAILAMKTKFQIKQSQFYDLNGQLIPIVHNVGMNSPTRCIRDFGYGKGRNKRKWITPVCLHAFFRLLNSYKRLRFGA